MSGSATVASKQYTFDEIKGLRALDKEIINDLAAVLQEDADNHWKLLSAIFTSAEKYSADENHSEEKIKIAKKIKEKTDLCKKI